jgi:hypothetical protein
MEKYNANLLDEMFRNFNEKLTSMDEKADRILEQTTKTNGRVSGLENREAQRVGYFNAVATFVIPTVMFLLYKQLS